MSDRHFSQNNEQEIILSHFRDRLGSFLDIGAHDGVTFSNTRTLALRGWRGVLVEPAPSVFPSLVRNCEGHPRLIPINAAIVENTTGVRPFWDSNGDCVSTFNDDRKPGWEKIGISFTNTDVHCLSAHDLSRMIQTYWPLISIDVEGNNVPLLRALIDNGFDCEMLCIEHDNRIDEIKKIVPAHTKELLRNAENLILVRPS